VDDTVVHETLIAAPGLMKGGVVEIRIQSNDLTHTVSPVRKTLGQGDQRQGLAGSLGTVSLPAIAYTDLVQVLHGHCPDPDGDLRVNAEDADVEVVAGGVAVADDAALPDVAADDVVVVAAAAGEGDGRFERHSVSVHIRQERRPEAVGRMILAAAQLQPSSLKSYWD
jgi:hypothetical protein